MFRGTYLVIYCNNLVIFLHNSHVTLLINKFNAKKCKENEIYCDTTQAFRQHVIKSTCVENVDLVNIGGGGGEGGGGPCKIIIA